MSRKTTLTHCGVISWRTMSSSLSFSSVLHHISEFFPNICSFSPIQMEFSRLFSIICIAYSYDRNDLDFFPPLILSWSISLSSNIHLSKLPETLKDYLHSRGRKPESQKFLELILRAPASKDDIYKTYIF